MAFTWGVPVVTVADYLGGLSACFSAVEATGPQGQALSPDEAVSRCVERLKLMHAAGGTVYLIGNGGSAAVVSHAQNDLVKAAGIRAHVCQDTPLMSAYGNDCAPSLYFAKPLDVFLRSNDVVLAVSSSGASANVLNAVQLARQKHCVVITLSGFESTNRLRHLGDLNFYVPSSDYGPVELTHAALLHHLTDELAHAG